MKHTVGNARMFAVGMILMGGALGMFGDEKMAAANQAFPQMPRTDQEQTVQVENNHAAPPKTQRSSLVARRRSGETDPCVPVVPVTFSGHVPVMC